MARHADPRAIEAPEVVTRLEMASDLDPRPRSRVDHGAIAIAAALTLAACGDGSDAAEGSGGTCGCPGSESEGSAGSGEAGTSTAPGDSTGACDDDCTTGGDEPPSMCDVQPPAGASPWSAATLPHGITPRPSHHWPSGFRDVDGDGNDDVVVRTSTPDGPGPLAVVFGPIEPGELDVAAHVDGGGGFWIVVDAVDPMAGFDSAEIGGDRNGDGLADIFVRSTNGSECQCGDDECIGTNEHTLYAVHGKADNETIELSSLVEPAGLAIRTVETNAPCGTGGPPVWPLGDVDGDGLADAAIGPSAGPPAWLPGAIDTSMDLADLDTSFVPSGPAGDVDGDGIADFVQREAGALVVRLGAPDLPSAATAYAMDPGGLDGFSAAVVAAGDVDGDGVPDLATGPWIDQAAGDGLRRTFVVFGRTDGAVVSAAQLEAGEGGFMIGLPDEHVESLAAPGDFDGDGLADIALGIRHHVFVVLGKPDGALVTLGSSEGVIPIEVDDEPCAQHFGRVLWAPGDLHGDGTGDLMAPLYASLVVLDGDG
jgi:hypothetical protein